jgi:hypothetical protein
MRITVSMAAPLLRRIKDLANKENKSLTCLIGELLNLGLESRGSHPKKLSGIKKWNTQKLGARFDYLDKEQLYRHLDQE